MTRGSFCVNADGSPKWTYLDKREAKRIVRTKASLPAYRQAGMEMHLYLCPDCRLYHVGHQRA